MKSQNPDKQPNQMGQKTAIFWIEICVKSEIDFLFFGNFILKKE